MAALLVFLRDYFGLNYAQFTLNVQLIGFCSMTLMLVWARMRSLVELLLLSLVVILLLSIMIVNCLFWILLALFSHGPMVEGVLLELKNDWILPFVQLILSVLGIRLSVLLFLGNILIIIL